MNDWTTPEQRTKAKACKTPEDLLALAKKEGYELSVEQLEEVAGGVDMWCCSDVCGDENEGW